MYKLFIILMIKTIFVLNILANEIPDIMIHSSYQYYLSSKKSNYGFVDGNLNCCNDKVLGNGQGKNLLLSVKYNFFDIANLGLQIDYFTNRVTFKNSRNDLISVGGEPYNGLFSNNLEINSKVIGIGLQYERYFSNKFSILAGLNYSLINNFEYKYDERIEYPEDRGVFKETNSRIRNEIDGKINDLNYINLNFAAKYMLPLNRERSLFLTPIITYSYNFYSSASLQDALGNVGFGLGLEWNMGKNHYHEENFESSQQITEIGSVELTTTAISNDKEFYFDTLLVEIDNDKVNLNAEKIIFNILNNTIVNSDKWRLKIGTISNEYTKVITGFGDLPSFIPWDIDSDDDFKDRLILFKALSSSIPSRYSFDLKYELEIHFKGKYYKVGFGIIKVNHNN